MDDGETARAMVEFTQQRPIAFAGVAVQYRHKREPVNLENGRIWTDPKSIEPLLLAISFVETDGQGDLIYPFVCDLQEPPVIESLTT
ncbi:MAG TPA: hypothetical protein PLK67_17485, partial [Bryobacteraceae bacterium]|nr:hypothetical protein [Bryobacteraceae bacterium]